MSIDWCRLWHDMPTDPKFRAVAKRSGRPTAEVLSIFMAMMTNASANDDERGTLRNWSHEDMGVALDIETEHVEAIYCAMQGKLLDGDRLTGWERRQPKREDGSAERGKAWRERKRTQANAEKRPDSDSEKDTERTSLPSEQEPVRASDVQAVIQNGLRGKGGEVSAEAQREACALLGIANAAPLVARYRQRDYSRSARNPDKLFLSQAAELLRTAKPEERAACKPLADEPIPIKTPKASPQLAASLQRMRAH